VIEVRCACGERYHADTGHAGRYVQCRCGRIVLIHDTSSSTVPTPPSSPRNTRAERMRWWRNVIPLTHRAAVRVILRGSRILALAAAVLMLPWALGVALLTLLWLYFYTVGCTSDQVQDRTKAGVAFLCVGTVLLLVFHDGTAWWAAASLVVLGWILMAGEPTWQGW
jgi:hypothetical protein